MSRVVFGIIAGLISGFCGYSSSSLAQFENFLSLDAINKTLKDYESNPLGSTPIIGERQRIEAAGIQGQANWSGICDEGSFSNFSIYNPPDGWVVVESKLIITNNNNGSATIISASKGLKIASQHTVDSAYNALIDAAAKSGQDNYAAKLRTQRNEHLQIVSNYQTNKNTVQINASAKPQGSCFDRKGGSIAAHAEVTLQYVGSDNVESLKASVTRRNQK